MTQVSPMIARQVAGVAALAAALAIGPSAWAQTHDEIVAKCMEAARPQMMACMQGKRGSGNQAANLAQCRELIGASMVRPCVQREERSASAPPPRQPSPPPSQPPPAPPAPDGKPEAPASASKSPEPLRATFVAPPRNISDITAILDQEKPDPAKAARIKAEAEADPPASKDPRILADFYYQRAQARMLAGRPRDAIADCEKTS